MKNQSLIMILKKELLTEWNNDTSQSSIFHLNVDLI